MLDLLSAESVTHIAQDSFLTFSDSPFENLSVDESIEFSIEGTVAKKRSSDTAKKLGLKLFSLVRSWCLRITLTADAGRCSYSCAIKTARHLNVRVWYVNIFLCKHM